MLSIDESQVIKQRNLAEKLACGLQASGGSAK
jgi:hypothetical protein